VGIGTTSPGQKLTVSGNIYSSGTLYVNTVRSATGSDIIVSRDDTAKIVRLGSGDAYDKVHIYAGGGGDPKVYVGTNGNVGIGTTDPAYKFVVEGASHSYNVYPAVSGVDLYSTGNIAPHYQTSVDWYTGVPGSGTHRMRLDSSGNLGLGTISPFSAMVRIYTYKTL